MIEKEQNSVTTYSQLLDVFLGDYPTPIYEKTLRLPKYDHSLTLKEEDLEDGSQLELINSDTRNANDKDKQARVTMFTRKYLHIHIMIYWRSLRHNKMIKLMTK